MQFARWPAALMILAVIVIATPAMAQDQIVHDAVFYVLEAQHGERWTAEDGTLDEKLAALKEKFGRPPNLIHIMWDDTAFGDVGIPPSRRSAASRRPTSTGWPPKASSSPACTRRWVAPRAARPAPPAGWPSAAVCTTSGCSARATGCAPKK